MTPLSTSGLTITTRTEADYRAQRMQMFGAVLKLGMDNANAYRKTAAPRRAEGNGGYHENYNGDYPFRHNVRIEIFAETHDRCEQVVAGYLRMYPAANYDTKIFPIKEVDGEFVAMGRRNEERREA